MTPVIFLLNSLSTNEAIFSRIYKWKILRSSIFASVPYLHKKLYKKKLAKFLFTCSQIFNFIENITVKYAKGISLYIYQHKLKPQMSLSHVRDICFVGTLKLNLMSRFYINWGLFEGNSTRIITGDFVMMFLVSLWHHH